MLSVLLWAMVFLASLAVLVKASVYFTDSAERIGIAFGISPFIIGVTIVSVGTSTPELVSSILAVMKGSSEIVVGNVMGSNVTNMLSQTGGGAPRSNLRGMQFKITSSTQDRGVSTSPKSPRPKDHTTTTHSAAPTRAPKRVAKRLTPLLLR